MLFISEGGMRSTDFECGVAAAITLRGEEEQGSNDNGLARRAGDVAW